MSLQMQMQMHRFNTPDGIVVVRNIYAVSHDSSDGSTHIYCDRCNEDISVSDTTKSIFNDASSRVKNPVYFCSLPITMYGYFCVVDASRIDYIDVQNPTDEHTSYQVSVCLNGCTDEFEVVMPTRKDVEDFLNEVDKATVQNDM